MIEIAKAFAHGVMCGCNIEDIHGADEWYGGEDFDVNVFGSHWGDDIDDPHTLKVVIYKVVDGEIQFEQVLYTAFLSRSGWQEVA